MKQKLIILVMLLGMNNIQAEIISVEKLIKDIEYRPENEQLYIINKEVNKYTYKEDLKLYKKNDYWATPKEFLKNKGGDCEDFAIMKYSLLRKIGYTEDRMRFIYTNYKNKKTGEDLGHLVLAVKNNNGTEIILDNTKVIPLEHDYYFKANKLEIEFTLKTVLKKMNKKDNFKIT